MWKMASDGLDTLREVVVRSSQTGRLRVDLALLAREKQQLLARMGAELGRLFDAGETTDAPEALEQIRERVKDVDARMTADAGRAHDNAYGARVGTSRKRAGTARPRKKKTRSWRTRLTSTPRWRKRGASKARRRQKRGSSSGWRAPQWHCGGRGFDPLLLHYLRSTTHLSTKDRTNEIPLHLAPP